MFNFADANSQIVAICLILVISVLAASYIFSRSKFLPSLDKVNGRYVYIDGLRGLAALGVFINHVPFVLMGIGIVNNNIKYNDTYSFSGLGAFGVQIFFCITAFLFTEKMLSAENGIDWGKFYTNRLCRLVPIYFFVVTLAIIFAFIMRDNSPIKWDHTFVDSLKLYSFYFIQFQPIFGFNITNVLGNLWTLPYEWRFYLLMPVFFWLLREGGPWRLTLLILIAIAIMDLKTSQQAFWPYFMGGIFASLILNRFHLRDSRWRMVCGVASLLFFILPFFKHPHLYGLHHWMTTSLGFVLLVLADFSFLKLRTLRFLGEISYSFYLLGVFLAITSFLVLAHFKNLTHMHFKSFLMWEAIITIFIIGICTLTFRFIEYPFLRRKQTEATGNLRFATPIMVGN